jgi:hypothetical protein
VGIRTNRENMYADVPGQPEDAEFRIWFGIAPAKSRGIDFYARAGLSHELKDRRQQGLSRRGETLVEERLDVLAIDIEMSQAVKELASGCGTQW